MKWKVQSVNKTQPLDTQGVEIFYSSDNLFRATFVPCLISQLIHSTETSIRKPLFHKTRATNPQHSHCLLILLRI